MNVKVLQERLNFQWRLYNRCEEHIHTHRETHRIVVSLDLDLNPDPHLRLTSSVCFVEARAAS